VEHWANGGETALANLVHLCSFHHRALHEGGFTVEGSPDGELTFRNRYGVIGAPIDYGLAVAGLFRTRASRRPSSATSSSSW